MEAGRLSAHKLYIRNSKPSLFVAAAAGTAKQGSDSGAAWLGLLLKIPTRAWPNNRIYGCHLPICQIHLKRHQRDTSLSLCARPRSDVPAAASNEQPAFACAHTQARHRAHSLGRRRSTRTCGARALRRAGWSRSMPYESPLRQRDGPLLWCMAALCLASNGLQCAVSLRVYARQNATALSLSGGGASRALVASARCAALVGVGSCPMQAHRASKTALSLGARPRSDVPAKASNKKPACACAQ